uniref:Uncharacterized protein n=1 Tax=Babesia bovis TaxID=5865 RepID=S6C7F3_BABBO|nr:hypothetical protein [Babesia bovis]
MEDTERCLFSGVSDTMDGLFRSCVPRAESDEVCTLRFNLHTLYRLLAIHRMPRTTITAKRS